MPAYRAKTALSEGLKFGGSSILGCNKISDSDMHLAPDYSTFKILPDCISPIPSALILCDIQLSETELFEGAPRTVLKKIQRELTQAGFELLCGHEFFHEQLIDQFLQIKQKEIEAYKINVTEWEM